MTILFLFQGLESYLESLDGAGLENWCDAASLWDLCQSTLIIYYLLPNVPCTVSGSHVNAISASLSTKDGSNILLASTWFTSTMSSWKSSSCASSNETHKSPTSYSALTPTTIRVLPVSHTGETLNTICKIQAREGMVDVVSTLSSQWTCQGCSKAWRVEI